MIWLRTTHIHTYPFNGPLSGTTRVSWYQKGITNLDFNEARDSEWQWHQLSHMQLLQVCTFLQTDDHASTPPHTHTFNGPFSGTTRVSRYQKAKTSLDFTEARDSEWQWHQLGHMQVCTLLQTDDHASTPPHICIKRQLFYAPL